METVKSQEPQLLLLKFTLGFSKRLFSEATADASNSVSKWVASEFTGSQVSFCKVSARLKVISGPFSSLCALDLTLTVAAAPIL